MKPITLTLRSILFSIELAGVNGVGWLLMSTLFDFPVTLDVVLIMEMAALIFSLYNRSLETFGALSLTLVLSLGSIYFFQLSLSWKNILIFGASGIASYFLEKLIFFFSNNDMAEEEEENE